MTHCLAIQIVSIKVHDKLWWFIFVIVFHIFIIIIFVIVFHIFVISLSISVSNLTDTITCAFFNELKYIYISHQFQFYVGHLQHSISWQSRRSEIMTWLKFEALQTSASDDFKYISQKQNIISKIQVMIITHCLEIGCLSHFLCMFILFFRQLCVI